MGTRGTRGLRLRPPAQPQGRALPACSVSVTQLKNTDTRLGSQSSQHVLPRLPLIIILSLPSEVGPGDSCPVS